MVFLDAEMIAEGLVPRTLKHEVTQVQQQIAVVGEPHRWWHTARITCSFFH